MLFPQFSSFLLVCSFQFSFGCALRSTHFVYRLPGQAILDCLSSSESLKQKKKRICKIVDFDVPDDVRIKLKEWEKKDKYLDLARELKKTMEHEGDNYIKCDWCFWYSN